MRTRSHIPRSATPGAGSSVLAAALAMIMASPLLASDQGATPSRRGRRAPAQQGSPSNPPPQTPPPAGQHGQAGQGNAHGVSRGNGSGRARGHASGQPAAGRSPAGHAYGHGPATSHAAPARPRPAPYRTYAHGPQGHTVVRRGCGTPACAPYRTHAHGVVVAQRPYPVYYAAAPAPMATYTAPAPAEDRFDLGLGLGLAAASPQLQSSLPLLTGKVRALGEVTPHLGLGLDLDVSSLVLVNHATLSAVASYDLLGSSEIALRPYVSLGAGVLNLITTEYLFVGPAVSARAGVEFKPWRWLGLSVEAGSVASMMNALPVAVPYAGGTLALYLL